MGITRIERYKCNKCSRSADDFVNSSYNTIPEGWTLINTKAVLPNGLYCDTTMVCCSECFDGLDPAVKRLLFSEVSEL